MAAGYFLPFAELAVVVRRPTFGVNLLVNTLWHERA